MEGWLTGGRSQRRKTVSQSVSEAIQGSAEFSRLILENAQIGIGIFNIQTGQHFSNPAMREMLGYSQEELSRTEQWDQIVHPDERASGARRYAAIVQGRCDKDEWEQRFIRRDGDIVIAIGRFKLIRDAAGKPKYVVALNEDVTERRLAEAERNRITKRMQLLLDSTGQGVYGVDLQGNCTFINKATCEMIGYRPEEVVGRNMHELVHHHKPDGSPYSVEECPVSQTLTNGKGCRVEEEILWRGDGTPISVEYSSFPVVEEGGIQGAVVTVSDNTERKRAKEALQSSERLFRSIFENAQIGIGVFKIESQQHFSNRALREMLGYPGDELTRLEQWDEIVPEEERTACAQRYAELVEGKREKDEYEQHFVHRTGRIILGNSRFQLLRDSAGKPQYVVALTEDITEHRRATEALTASEQLFRTVFENAQIGIGILDIQTGIHLANHAQTEMLGYTQDELSRLEQWDKVVPPEDRAAGASRYAAMVEGRRDEDGWERRFIRRDGRIVIANVRFKLIRDAAGKPKYIIALNEDITQRKRVEAELLKAKESAEAATRSKSEFLANMSHEIRTPMNAVLGMTHLALKTELTSKQRDYLTKAKAAAESLLGVINDILDFSKIEAGKLNMEHTDFRLEAVLDHLSSVVSHRVHEKNLEFLVAAEPDLPTVLVGDPLRLGQVLINLVNNAVKFTERGEIVVAVKLEERVSDRVKLKIAVRDSGIGLAPDHTARLFQAFSQADSSTTRKYGGTGLGLSISKRLVEMMEGRIWVESEYGHGSTFCFTAWFGVGSAERRQKALPPGLASARVLVVDDNAVAREILADMLRQLRFRVESVSSGSEAFEELGHADKEDPYRLVLMDWDMPSLGGLETVRRIKRPGTLGNVPKIVMITEFGREDVRLQAREGEVERFLQKPVSPSVLFDTLMSLFSAAGEEMAPSSPGKSERGLQLASGIRVLLVEDNEVNQQVAKELLESEGARVTIANHGAEAVGILTEGEQPPPFDVVFMDLQMPEMDGLAATKVLRARPQLQDLPIIAMTAHVMTEEVERCLEAGMNDHVGKPIDPDGFFATLARWTRGHPRTAFERPARAASAEDEITVPDIEGVDVLAGLRRAAGNKRLYRDLLTQFVSKQESAAQRIRAALESGNRHHAERLAHSLKGAAGNLGIQQVFSAAGTLETALSKSLDDVEDLVKKLAAALDRQFRAIRESLKATPLVARKRARPVGVSEISAAMMRLRELLEASDAEAPQTYENLAELLEGAVDRAQLDALGAAVRAFDFETALVKLNEISKQ
jgi:two-component system, sensor histidine kinase and response regulator